jgi:hypothetical protein
MESFMLTIHHNVHACELRPNLSEKTNVRPVDVLRVEQLPVSHISVQAFKLAVSLDLLEFTCNKWGVAVALAVHKRKDIHALLPAIFASEPYNYTVNHKTMSTAEELTYNVVIRARTSCQ